MKESLFIVIFIQHPQISPCLHSLLTRGTPNPKPKPNTKQIPCKPEVGMWTKEVFHVGGKDPESD